VSQDITGVGKPRWGIDNAVESFSDHETRRAQLKYWCLGDVDWSPAGYMLRVHVVGTGREIRLKRDTRETCTAVTNQTSTGSQY